MRSKFIAALAVAAVLGLGAAGGAARAGDVETAQDAVFAREHLQNLAAPTTLHYAYHRSGSLLPALTDRADLVITEIRPDASKQVAFRLFSGPNERRFEPRQGYRSNPLIVVFLQRDVEQMGRLTGGSPHYFRQRIREAFGDARAIRAEPVTVRLQERELAGTKVTLEPFLRDPSARRFPEFQRKRYEFIMAPDVPGGVYSLRAVTPGVPAEGGPPLLDETIIYDGEM